MKTYGTSKLVTSEKTFDWLSPRRKKFNPRKNDGRVSVKILSTIPVRTVVAEANRKGRGISDCHRRRDPVPIFAADASCCYKKTTIRTKLNQVELNWIETESKLVWGYINAEICDRGVIFQRFAISTIFSLQKSRLLLLS